ncbi:MAG: hypothetical protein BRD46_01520, partial [Bacteroidetes bacterium QS_8_68_15]
PPAAGRREGAAPPEAHRRRSAVAVRRARTRVARALGIPARRVRQDLEPGYYLDSSVVLGEDYLTLTPFRRDAAPAVP